MFVIVKYLVFIGILFVMSDAACQDQQRALRLMDSLYALATNVNLTENERLKHYGEATYAVYKDLDYGIKICSEFRELAHKNNRPGKECYALDRLGYAYMARGDLKLAKDALEQCIAIAKENNFHKKLISGLAGFGNFHAEYGNLDTALVLHQKSLELALKGDNFIYQARAHINIGEIYAKKGAYGDGLTALSKARGIIEARKTKGYYASLYNAFGDLYALIDEPQKALKFYTEALSAAKELYNHGKVIETQIRIGTLHLARNDLSSAEKTIDDALSLAEEQSMHAKMASIYLGKAKVALSKKEYNKSIEFIELGLKVNSDNKIQKNVELYKFWLGHSHFKKGDFQKARDHLTTAYHRAKITNNSEVIRNSSELLWKIYKELGDHKKSLQFFEEYTTLQTIYDDEETVKDLLKSEMQRDFAEKSIRDSINEVKRREELAKKHLRSSERQWNNLLLSVAISLGLLAVIFVLFRNRRRSKAYNQTLERKNEQIEQALKDKSTLLREINHRVKNNMQVASSVLQLKAKNSQSPEAQKALLDSQLRLQSMQMAHEKIFESENYESVDILSYSKDLVQVLGNSLLSDTCELSVQGDLILINVEQAQAIGFILHELFTNSAKYAWEEGDFRSVAVTIYEREGHVLFTYSDNGRGLPADFDFAEAQSFGMRLIYSMVQRQLIGTIEYQYNSGAHFHIEFKKR